MSFGQGVERIFPFNSKVIDKIEKIRSYKVRRAKLFYIRGLRGKAARLKEVDRVDVFFADSVDAHAHQLWQRRGKGHTCAGRKPAV
jgi:hypothetical protein